MLYYAIKVLVSAVLIVAITELAKRHSSLAAIMASLPLTSLLAFVWLYVEGGQVSEIAKLSSQIFWLVLPSLLLFIVFPLLLQYGWNFWLSLLAAVAATALAYFVMTTLLHRFGTQ